MKKAILFLCVVLAVNGVIAQDSLVRHYWTSGTANNLPAKRMELALFTTSGYGISNKVELSLHPLMFFVMPQVSVKIGWGKVSKFTFATEHGILYPTMFMRLVSTSGTGGLISPEFTIPQMVAIYNRLLVSMPPFSNGLLTAHAGIALSIKSGPLDPRTTIDLPVIYPLFAVFYSQPEFDAGIELRGKLVKTFGWIVNVENFIVCGTEQNYFMENKGVLTYTSIKNKFHLEAGYKLCFGQYPAGPQWHLLPVVDLAFCFGK
ncbi:MAG: hypothetical protein WCL00_10460 [Bacteroidota bacterium]